MAGLWVETPYEAYPLRGVYRSNMDLDRPDVRLGLVAEIRSGFVRYIHFGLPCKGWANANTLNGGTRRQCFPLGIPPILEREALSNTQGSYVVELCEELMRAGGWFSIENPMGEFLLGFSRVREVAG